MMIYLKNYNPDIRDIFLYLLLNQQYSLQYHYNTGKKMLCVLNRFFSWVHPSQIEHINYHLSGWKNNHIKRCLSLHSLQTSNDDNILLGRS